MMYQLFSEKSRDLYDLKQKQRYYEREIRKTKLQLVGKQAQIDNIAETDVKEIFLPRMDFQALNPTAYDCAYNYNRVTPTD